MHYLDRKWYDATRPPLARLSRSELMIADYLRGTDPERTVILHDRPFDPSLVPVVTKRRVVLAWARYAVGSDDRRRDVDAFFDSAAGDPATAEAILRRYRVTHVLVRPDRDHIHPDVLARLQQVVSFPDAQLYRVPEGAESASP